MDKTTLANDIRQFADTQDSMQTLAEFEHKIARALKKSAKTLFGGTKSFNEYFERFAYHALKAPCKQVLAELKEIIKP